MMKLEGGVVLVVDDGILLLVVVGLQVCNLLLEFQMKITHLNKVYNPSIDFYFVPYNICIPYLHNFMR